MNENLLKAFFFLVIFVVLLFQAFLTSAQTHKGLDGSFGSRHFIVRSNIEKLHNTETTLTGGRLGFVFGNSKMIISAGAGYFTSTNAAPGTIDDYQLESKLNVYPLAIFSVEGRLHPYLTGGISLDQLKFYGFYINAEPGHTNYSQAEAPYLGSLRQVNARFGGGLDLSVVQSDLIHLYADLSYGKTFSQKSDAPTFAETSLVKAMQINIGVIFSIAR